MCPLPARALPLTATRFVPAFPRPPALQEHRDYELVQSSNPAFNKAIVRVNIFRESHRQTIQYIQPQDAHKLGQAELVCIDEVRLGAPHLALLLLLLRFPRPVQSPRASSLSPLRVVFGR